MPVVVGLGPFQVKELVLPCSGKEYAVKSAFHLKLYVSS
jgi:hypothetical protein